MLPNVKNDSGRGVAMGGKISQEKALSKQKKVEVRKKKIECAPFSNGK